MDSINKLLSWIGYGLKLGGMGISRPPGTPYKEDLTPTKVYDTIKKYGGAPNTLYAKEIGSIRKNPIYGSTFNNANPVYHGDTTTDYSTYNVPTSGGGGGGNGGGNGGNNGGGGGNPNYEEQLARARQQALDNLKANLGILNQQIEQGKAEALRNRDILAGNIANAFGIRQTGDWGNPQYNDISVGNGDLNSQFELARQKWYSDQSPQSLLSQLFNALSTGRSNLQRERTNIENLYGDETKGTGLLGEAQNTRDTQDKALNQEDINTIIKYSQAGGIARRAMESALNRNRMAARAGGRLGSSFYDQLQADVRNTAARTIAGIAQEEANKRSDISRERTNLSNWLTKQLAAYKAEKALKGEAINQKEADMFNDMIRKANEIRSGAIEEYRKIANEYNNAVNVANNLKALNDINYNDLVSGIESNYQTGLNNIQNYLQSRALQEAAIRANAGNYNTGYNVYTPNSTGYNITKDIGSITNKRIEAPNIEPGMTRRANINPFVDKVNSLRQTFDNKALALNTLLPSIDSLDAILAMVQRPTKKITDLERYLNYINA